MLGEDPALLAAFLDESRESCDGLEAQIVGFAQAEDLVTAVQAVFRPIHTFKGNAPFFGLHEGKRLAHAMETVLDHLRNRRLSLTAEITAALLAALDGLRALISRVQAGGPEVEDPAAHEALIARLEAIRPEPEQLSWDPVYSELAALETLGCIDAAGREHIERLRRLLAERGSALAKPAARRQPQLPGVEELRRRLAQPLASPLPPSEAEDIVARLRALRAQLNGAEAARLDEALETCAAFLPTIGFDELLRQHVLERLPASAAASEATAPRAPQTDRIERGTDRVSRGTDSERLARTMRVSEAAVDAFLAHVGDLLVVGDQLEHLQRRLALGGDPQLARDLARTVMAFDGLSTALQRSIMAIRRVPARQLLQKVPRLVRDIAAASGKEIAAVVEGETAEVDKSRLELLDGPLTHLVRNAADHGIEPPEARRAAGKPAQGTVTVCAACEEEWFVLTVSDDGRGIDPERVRRKAVEKGLVAADRRLSEQECIELLFLPGFSTAERVTEVSGRGIGMDVVRRAVTEAGGDIQVETALGRGTTWRLRVPQQATTQIMTAYLMAESEQVYGVPISEVGESFAADGQTGGVVLRHGRTLPVVALAELLGLPPPVAGARRTLAVVHHGGRDLAVSFAAALGVRRVVLRPMPGIDDRRYQGAALLGDGRLALMLNLAQLLGSGLTAAERLGGRMYVGR